MDSRSRPGVSSRSGLQNQIHAHAWDFTDAPLANKVFLGNQLNETASSSNGSLRLLSIGTSASRPVAGASFLRVPRAAQQERRQSGNVFTHVGGDVERASLGRPGSHT